MKKSIFHGFLAFVYILLVVGIITFGEKLHSDQPEYLVPVAMISLFTLSAAVMGYLFCYQPAVLYIDGKNKEALHFFFETVLVFACITAFVFVLIFSGVLR